MTPEKLIPIFKPSCSKAEIQAVTQTLESGWWGLGPRTAEFERKFAEKVGVNYAVGVTSATAALDLALKAHEIKGGEIIVPALTFVSTALVGLYNDNKIVFADVDEKTLCIDWKDVLRKTTPQTKAFIPVHYAGRSAEVEVIQDFADQNGITIIEDCAHAAINPEVAKKNTGCWCLDKNTLIFTNKGLISIKEIVEKKLKYKVLSLINGTNKWVSVKNWFKWNLSQKIYSITLKTGQKIKITENHEIPLFKDGEIIWKKVKEINKGDFCIIPRILPSKENQDLLFIKKELTEIIRLNKLKTTDFKTISGGIVSRITKHNKPIPYSTALDLLKELKEKRYLGFNMLKKSIPLKTYYSPIIRIENLSDSYLEKFVYDIETESGNFLANGIFVHNSFHAVKNLACGDGGMISINNKAIYERLLPLRWCGIDKSTWERQQKKYGWDYSIEDIGYKAHMNDITASIGLAQLERLGQMNEIRKVIVSNYIYCLQDLPWIELPEYDENSSWHMFVIRVQERDRFIDHMLEGGISVGVHYKPLNQYGIFPRTELPVTDRVWKTLVTLPNFPDLTNDEFSYIIKTIRAFKP